MQNGAFCVFLSSCTTFFRCFILVMQIISRLIVVIPIPGFIWYGQRYLLSPCLVISAAFLSHYCKLVVLDFAFYTFMRTWLFQALWTPLVKIRIVWGTSLPMIRPTCHAETPRKLLLNRNSFLYTYNTKKLMGSNATILCIIQLKQKCEKFVFFKQGTVHFLRGRGSWWNFLKCH